MPSRASSALRRLCDPAAVDDRPGDQRLAAEKDVVGRRQFGNEIEFLMDDRDARPLGVLNAGELRRRAVEPNDAVVLDVHAGEDLHQGRLAGAVLADQRVHLAGPEIEIDVAERRDPAERFANARRLEDDAVAPVRPAGRPGSYYVSPLMHWIVVHLHCEKARERSATPSPLWGRVRVGGTH